LRSLPEDDPDRQRKLAYGENDLADWLYDCGRTREAERLLDAGVASLRPYLQESPRDPQMRHRFARSLERHARTLIGLGKFTEALARYDEILSVRKELAKDFQDVDSYSHSYVYERHQYARLLRQLGRQTEAEKELRETIAMSREPRFEHPLWVHAEARRDLGTLLRDSGRIEEAGPLWDGSLDYLERHLRNHPHNARMQSYCGWFLATFPDESRRDLQRALRLARQAVDQVPMSGVYWNVLGVCLYRAGQWPEAVAALKASMDRRSGGDAVDFFFTAMAHQRMGQPKAAQEWHTKAIVWMDENKPGDEELRQFRREAEITLKAAESGSKPPQPAE
jgi:tetratricopeptide (TPR) repeat protein